jgi:hypothetical protein
MASTTLSIVSAAPGLNSSARSPSIKAALGADACAKDIVIALAEQLD